MTRSIPKDPRPDSTLALALEGYQFISHRCDRYGTDVFETRLLGESTICLRGADAAEVFYDSTRMQRTGAFPRRVQQTLLGRGGVQALDGSGHRRRKEMLLTLLNPRRSAELARRVDDEIASRVDAWTRQPRVVLLDESARLLCRAVSEWADVPVPESDLPRRAADLTTMIEAAALVGPGHWRGRRARNRCEAWLGRLVGQVRDGRLAPSYGSALQVIATHTNADGGLLDRRTAAVELLNVLRPTVAVSRYVAFAALALHRQPWWRERLQAEPELVEPFVQEVRRFFPFFPAIAARVRQPFEWQGCHFPAGHRVLLDIYGTNRDPRRWTDPHRFDPLRFLTWSGDPFSLIPQGGGDHARQHRCPGEWLTIDTLSAFVRALTGQVDYRVPDQDLRIAPHPPARVRSGMVLAEVRRARQDARR